MSLLLPVRTSYADLLDKDTLLTILGAFQELHPDLLPIVVYRVLKESWFGELTDEEVKQALRDCYDQASRGLQVREGSYGLQSPSAFVASRLKLCLENQGLLVQLGCRDIAEGTGLACLPPPGSGQSPPPIRVLDTPPQFLAG
jgi:hypothetical protein